ncbi:33819_t:CDS:2, partial [Racocetra persica]
MSEKSKLEKNKREDSHEDDSEADFKRQKIKYFIIKLNEEYKLYRRNIRYRQNLCAAQIFISMMAIFLGKLFSLASKSNIMEKVGAQLSTTFGGIGVLVTIITAYINNTAQKYLDESSLTEIDKEKFKLMYLHIHDNILDRFSDEFDPDQTYVSKDVEHALRHSLLYLGEIWFGLIILSKSFDFFECLEFRFYSLKNDLQHELVHDEHDCKLPHSKKRLNSKD